MNIAELQAELRHFAAEREWQPFHTPKNLTTALMVEAAELAKIFQWMTPEASQGAHREPALKQRIGEEVADVLLYLLQVADRSEIDLAWAIRDKLSRNASKYPATQTIPRVSPARADMPGTHVLLDFENVQPTEDELRALVPDATQVWVFHGPHQRHIEQRFASFGDAITAVPISQTGKNALDFHLSFYMGYIASRNAASTMVVVANDKGYLPMLEHARAMGFTVRQLEHRRRKAGAPTKSTRAAKTGTATRPPARKTAARKTAAKKEPAKGVAAKTVTAAKTTARKTTPRKAAPRKTAARTPAETKTAARQPPASTRKVAARPAAAAVAVAPPASAPPASRPSVSDDLVRKVTENLRKMAAKRPVKAAPLRRLLKSLMGPQTAHESVEFAIDRLVQAHVVSLGAKGEVSYPAFTAPTASGSGTA